MQKITKISPFLWFDNQAEEAARFYTSIFPNSRITAIARYPEAGQETHGRQAGSVMTVGFELDGLPFTALNGGPVFQFNEAVSFVVSCDDQNEVDHFWNQLGEGGDEAARQCGWLKDKYGLAWQIVPRMLPELMTSGDPERSRRMFAAMMTMKKLDIAALKQAYES
jgi:predicted 3-demethylubiquinone-9 3-methyltransferase (glyoxalase superfamily)